MELLLFVAGWYVMGVIGNALILGVWWRESLDVEVEDLAIGAVMAWLGLANLIVGLLLAFGVLIQRLFRSAGCSGGRVVWSRRK